MEETRLRLIRQCLQRYLCWFVRGSPFIHLDPGNYLGIDVAIKEVLPSTDYDVAKYFEREWRLMKECRHPNICLFIGLSRAPPPDNRIFIVSEFIEGGNVRLYIHDKSKPFPWRLRMSFATDVARALAYLHARKCIHRDLKGENLLVTTNGRLKITDFGFARIAARNEEEMRRLTFCGTDSYMSPEILLGDEFDLPTDVFSLGIIFCEIAARRLADDRHFKRAAPTFGIDPAEVRKLASPGCPPDFLQLCLDCLNTDPSQRPTTRNILERLRVIEAEVLSRPNEGDESNANVGSIRFLSGAKRPGAAPRIPSFGMGVAKDIRASGDGSLSEEESDEELVEAVKKLSKVGLIDDKGTWSTSSSSMHPSWQSIPMLTKPLGMRPLIPDMATPTASAYSTNVVRQSTRSPSPTASSLSSIMTVRPSRDPTAEPADSRIGDPLASSSIMSIATLDSYRTAMSVSALSTTYATEGGSTMRSYATAAEEPTLVHRFTLVKPGAKPKKVSSPVQANGHATAATGGNNYTQSQVEVPSIWNPLEIFFSSGLLISKCDLCTKRIGWKPFFECDDCGLRCVACFQCVG
jgi:LIM domain kinase 1